MSPPRVLVVCLGNINRSPLCEAVLRAEGLVSVKSAGFHVERPQPAAKKTRDWAAEHGVDLSEHRSQQLQPSIVSWAQRIVVMSYGHADRLQKDYNVKDTTMIHLASYWGRMSVPDPAFLRADDPRFSSTLFDIVNGSRKLARYLLV